MQRERNKGDKELGNPCGPSVSFMSTVAITLAGAQRHNTVVSFMILGCQS